MASFSQFSSISPMLEFPHWMVLGGGMLKFPCWPALSMAQLYLASSTIFLSEQVEM